MELNAQQTTAGKNLLDELEHGIMRRLGEIIADRIAVVLSSDDTRDWSAVVNLIEYSIQAAFKIGDGGYAQNPASGFAGRCYLKGHAMSNPVYKIAVFPEGSPDFSVVLVVDDAISVEHAKTIAIDAFARGMGMDDRDKKTLRTRLVASADAWRRQIGSGTNGG